jgi:hypothetical protein
MIRRALGGILFFGGIYYVAQNPTDQFASILGIFSKVYSWIPILNNFSAESWLYLVFFFIAILAVRCFNTREALWLGRHLFWRTLFTVYAIVVITFAVINSALPLRMSVSWRVARDKGVLFRNPYLGRRFGRCGRIAKTTELFAITLVGNNAAIAQSVELLSKQRGFFRIGYKEVIGGILSPEDVMAILLLALLLFYLVVHRI